MTPKQNERYLKRMRAKALNEFASQSVGLRWLLAEAIKKGIKSAELNAKLRLRRP